jgi:hypothetical protein
MQHRQGPVAGYYEYVNEHTSSVEGEVFLPLLNDYSSWSQRFYCSHSLDRNQFVTWKFGHKFEHPVWKPLLP